MRTYTLMILGHLCGGLAGPLAAQDASPIVLSNVYIVDVTDGSIEENRSLVIRDGRIAVVGDTSVVTAPADADVVDGAGKYLIPGLWDMHTHLLWSTDASEHQWTDMPKDLDGWTLWERYYGPTLDLLVANGVTGVREMWGDLELARRVRQQAAAGERLAPRIVMAGHVIDGHPALWPGIVMVSTPSEAREAVDSLTAASAAFIKVRNRVGLDEYQAIIERAEEGGLPVAGHVPWLVRASEASDAGQRSIEHLTGVVEGCSTDQDVLIDMNRQILEALAERKGAAADSLEDRFFDRMLSTQDNSRCRSLLRHLARNETWQVPTLVLKRGVVRFLDGPGIVDEALLKYVHPDWRVTWVPENSPYGEKTETGYRHRLRIHERKAEITGMAAEEGVPLMAGTDTPNAFAFPGFSLHEELELMVEAGLSPLEALQSATIYPARFFNATDTLGSVEEGKLADLVLLDANPLEDIGHTRSIAAVVLDGQLLRRDELDALLKSVERAFADDTQ